jgi:hypothetical protein
MKSNLICVLLAFSYFISSPNRFRVAGASLRDFYRGKSEINFLFDIIFLTFFVSRKRLQL